MKKDYFIFLLFLFLVVSQGCKPGGGGQVGGSVSEVTGGIIPHDQELIIDEKSIKVDRITDKSCRIYWKTNVPATSCVEYGQSMNYDKTTAEDKNYTIEHYVEMYSLIPRKRFYFRVISSDVYNHLAQSRAEIYFETFDQNFAPAAATLNAPTNIKTNSMTVTWSQSYENDFLKYDLYRDTTAAVSYKSPKIATITSKMQTAFEDNNLSPNTPYYYLLYTYDTAELSTPSNIVCGTTSVLYNTLTKINFNEPPYKTTDSMVLSWNKCVNSDFSSYRVYWNDKPGVDTLSSLEVEITDANTTSVEITGLKENTTYYFKLYLKNKGIVFTASDEAAFKTYANGEHIKTINDIYYGNDVKIANNKAYITSYNYPYIMNLADYGITKTEIYGQLDRIRKPVSGDYIYIVNRTTKEIIEWDTVNDSMKRTLPCGNSPTDIGISAQGEYYYTTDLHEGFIHKYRLSDGGLVQSRYLTPLLTAVVAGRNNNDVFVARMASGSTNEVIALDSSDLSTKATIAVGEDPVYLYMDNGGLNVYCTSYKNKMVTRINSLTDSFVDTFEVGIQPHCVAQTSNGKYTFIANFGSSNISMFTNGSNRVTETFADGKTPRSLDVAATNRELLVLDYENHALNIYAIRK